MELLDSLQAASFKGVSFLVKNSSIAFGQKVAKHDYPNSNRTETEFLGQSLDVFSLDIYIHGKGQDYLQQRTALKAALSSEGEGILIHPYEGEIIATAMNPTLVESDRELGIARFNVTFQKVEKGIFPSQSGDNSAQIKQGADSFLSGISDALVNNVAIDGQIYDDFKVKSENLLQLFEEAKDIAAIAPDRLALYQTALNTFQTNLFGNIFDMADYATDLVGVLEKLLFLSDSAQSNIDILKTFFSFGDDDAPINNVTFAQQTALSNREALNDVIQGAALALAYTNAATIDFITDVELSNTQTLLEDQYDAIIEDMVQELRFTLSILRSDMKEYFDNQQVRRVVSVQVSNQSLTNVVYGYYGTLDDYDQFFGLNNRLNPLLINGNVTILADG
jgi:hypothetical protein